VLDGEQHLDNSGKTHAAFQVADDSLDEAHVATCAGAKGMMMPGLWPFELTPVLRMMPSMWSPSLRAWLSVFTSTAPATPPRAYPLAALSHIRDRESGDSMCSLDSFMYGPGSRIG
jgi:hypothetical protein